MKKSLTFVALSCLLIGGGLLGSCGETSVAPSVQPSVSTTPSVSEAGSSADAGSSDAASSEEAASSEDAASSEASSSISVVTSEIGPSDATRLTMWISAADDKATADLVTAFNTKYPDTPVSIGVSEVEEGDVGKQYASDPTKTPDIAHVPGDVVNSLQKNANIAVYPAADVKSYIGSDISASALSVAKFSGNQYGIPFSLNTFYLYYDSSYFTAEDVKSLDKMAAAINAKPTADKIDDVLALDVTNGWYQQSLFMSTESGIFADDGTSETATNLMSDDGKNVAKLIRSMYQASSPAYELGGDTDMKAALAAHSCKAFVSGSWNYDLASKSFGGNDKVGMTCLPNIKLGGVDTPWLSVGDYKSIVVSNNSAHKTLAQKFAYFLASEEGQRIRYEKNGGGTMPTSNALNADADFIAKNPFANVIGAVSENGVFKQNTCAQFGSKWWDSATAFGNAIKAKKNMTDTELFAALDALDKACLGK